MTIDKLQEKIRKLKNPSMIRFDVLREQIPPYLLEQEGSLSSAYGRFCAELLEGLKGTVPAARFGFDAFALLGPEGLIVLKKVLQFAKSCGFYVLLDSTLTLSPQAAELGASVLLGEEWLPLLDGLCISPYIGSDGVKPYIARLAQNDKDLFVTLRTANKSALELQDLLTGGRHVYTAAADMVNYLGQPLTVRSGYSRVAGVGAASSADSLRTLRSKYPSMFLLIDGLDYSGANAKNCSAAFDRMGHGAIACAGASVVVAWQQEESDGTEYVAQAVSAADRIKKNLLRYITVL